MKYILSLIISGALVFSGFGQTRNVLVGTNNAVVQPTNFWGADASNARSGLGLGTAATNPASAFQPSSTALSNLATGNGSALSNLQATNLVGVIPVSNIPSVTLTNIGGTLAINSGGTGATNASNARQNLGSTIVGDALFTATNAEAARTTLSLGTAATSAVTAFQPANTNLTNLSTNNGASLTGIPISGVANLQSSLDAKLATNGNASGLSNITASNISGTVALASNITGTAALATNVTGVVSILNGGTGTTNATDARLALGLGTAATSAATSFQPSSSSLTNLAANNGGSLTNIIAGNVVGTVNLASNVSGTVSLANGGTGATNAAGARTSLELGTAATNPSTAFQASSSVLTNLAANNGGSLTNIAAANITGTVALASNITGTAPSATNVTGVVSIANGGTGTNSASGARTAFGATTVGANLFTLANPDDTRFIRINANNSVSSLTAADMRTSLSVGTNLGTVTSVGMTVPSFLSVSTATIASSGTFAITLNNQTSRQLLITPNGGGIPAFRLLESDDLPSLAISKITGLQTALDGKLSTTGTATLATNVTGIVALVNGGTGATNAASARTALGATAIGSELLTLINPSAIRFLRLNADNTATALSASDFRTAIGLDTAATNSALAFQPASTNLNTLAGNNGSGLTNLVLSNVVGLQSSLDDKLATNGSAAGLTGFVGTTNAATARTNLNLGWSALTNTNAVGFRNALEIGTTNTLTIAGITAQNITVTAGGGITLQSVITNAASFRTNISLPWSGLTNTNAATFQTALFGTNTNPVLVNTNGEVVSPTNFWTAAPISTTVQYQTNVTGTSTNAATNSRNLFLFSLAPSVSGVTNTVTLPTNPATTFEGDRATITHLAQSTNTVTAIRQLGAATNLITLNQLDETVLLMYRGGAWMLADNISYIEPIYFSGTNAAANAAASRTNLGLGTTNNVSFGSAQISSDILISNTTIYWSGAPKYEIETGVFFHAISFDNTTNASESRTNFGLPLPALTNTNVTNFRTAIGLGATNDVTFSRITADFLQSTTTNASIELDDDNFIIEAALLEIRTPITFDNSTNASVTRTNLGLPLPALTNTNNANFRNAIELGATNNVSFSNVTASGTLTATGTVTATTNLVVNGFVNFSTNHTNSNPATNNQINDFIEIRVGTNQFWLPVYK